MAVYDERGRRDKKSLNKVLTFFSLFLFFSRRIGLKEEGEKKWLYLYLVSFDCADACMNGHTNNLLAPLALSLSCTSSHTVSGKTEQSAMEEGESIKQKQMVEYRTRKYLSV